MIKKISEYFMGFTIASAPILSLYRLGPISVSLYLMLFCYLFLVHDKLYCFKRNKCMPIWHLALVLAFLSINGLFLPYAGYGVLFSILMMLIETFMLLPIMASCSRQAALRSYMLIGYICCFVAIYQCYSDIVGLPHYSGRFEFLELDSSVSGWMEDSFGYRFNSLFSEPSYFAIYLLPLVAYSLISHCYINATIFSFCLILSSSSTGIIGLVLVLIYEICYKNLYLNKDYKSLLLIIGIALVGIYFFLQNAELVGMFLRSSNKITEISSGNSDDRLFGGIDLFYELSLKESMLGVGLSQMGNYFFMNGHRNIANYANTIVYTLLNSGIIGLIFLLVFYYRTYKLSQKYGNFAVFLIFLAVSCIDPILFNQRFFHFIYFIYFVNCNLLSKQHSV